MTSLSMRLKNEGFEELEQTTVVHIIWDKSANGNKQQEMNSIYQCLTQRETILFAVAAAETLFAVPICF
jgi:hypothetical protein